VRLRLRRRKSGTSGENGGGDLRPHLAGERAGGAGADEVDHIPPLVSVQYVGKAGHHTLVHPVADPPEEVALAVREEMRLGQIGRPYRRAGGGRAITVTARSVAEGTVISVETGAAGDESRGIGVTPEVRVT
jgi:hypothetical protein